MIQSTVYSLNSTPTQIFAGNGATYVHIHCSQGAALIGGSDVSAQNGYQVDNGEKVIFQTHESAMWVMANGASATIKVLVLTK